MSEDEFGLVMPFVTVQSRGGPHEDNAYVAGYEMGALDERLGHAMALDVETTVHAANLPQAELIAMKHGYDLELITGDGDWMQIMMVYRGVIEPDLG